ncbi:uncharacterized protein LOC135215153 [Macrobrachium nipponense]|uniref:uncharacterized protein LOC135215153 n=1 Tax=Macrobrachium nipponense TaxID=159736 RepID=UPI0030C80619
MDPTKSSSASTFTDENINCFRLMLIVDTVYRTFMRWVFYTDATDKDDDETLEDYLVNKRNMTHPEYRTKFNRTMKGMIKSDKSCQSFDISLWLYAIKYGCKEVASPDSNEWKQSGTFEHNLVQMKKDRDALEHGKLSVSKDAFDKKVPEIEDLLTKTMKLAEVKYKKFELKGKAQEYLDTIKLITQYPLTAKEFESYKQNALLQRNQEAILKGGRAELIELHKGLSAVGALTSLLKPKERIDVTTLFVKPHIVALEHEGEDIKPIAFSQMLEYAENQKGGDCNIAQTLLIAGAAGSGKSTIIKMFLSEWSSNSDSVRGLDHYKVLLFVDCRNVEVTCLCKLACAQMPKTSMKMSEKEMLYSILSLPTLIIFDGLDETNSNAENLLQEVLNIQTNDNITIMATVRTERYEEFSYRIPDDLQRIIFYLKGVTASSRELLVRKLHKKLKDKGMAGGDIEGLLLYLRTREASLKAFWNLPFNLVLVTYLWAENSESVRTITTPVELYSKINEQIRKRIHDRLARSDGFIPTLEKRIDAFINGLCWEALKGIRENSMTLNKGALGRLNYLSKSMSLHLDEMLGSFLQLDPLGEFSFFHRAQQEFFASWYIIATVTNKVVSSNVESIKKKIMESFENKGISTSVCKDMETYISDYLKDFQKDGVADILRHVSDDTMECHLTKYQNTLVNLMELLNLNKSSVSKALYAELLDLLNRSGVKDKESWIAVLNNVKCEEEVLKQICAKPGMQGGTANITIDNLVAYNSLIKYISVNQININISVNPIDFVPPFDQLIDRLVEIKAPVRTLILQHLFRHPRSQLVDTSLKVKIIQLVNKSPLTKYFGPVYPAMSIPMTVVNIQASVSQSGSFAQLKNFAEANPHLETLHVCVDLDIDPKELSSLPRVKHWLRLYLPDVTESSTKMAFSVIKALAPQRDRVKEVFFPRCSRDTRVLKALMLEARKRVHDHFEYYFPKECEHFFLEYNWPNAFCGDRGIDDWT